MPGKKQSQLGAITSVVDADEMNVEQSGTSKRIPVGLVQTQLPFNYIGGLITANNGGDPDADIDIAAGEARDSTGVDNMRLAAAITKQIDAAWAVGTDQGGMDTGAVGTDLMYAIWLIKRSDTGVVDALFSLSFTAPTMPADYDRKRLIGAIRTDGSDDILLYTQVGDYFRYDDPITDVNDNTMTTQVYKVGTLSVPPQSLAKVYGSYTNLASTDNFGSLHLRPNGVGDDATAAEEAFAHIATSGTFDRVASKGDVLTDGSSQIQYAVTFASGAELIQVRTMGFTMLTRREP